MKVPEHIALSVLLAQFGVQQHDGWGGTALVVVAGCLPDIDGLSIVLSWQVYRRVHRVLGHGLPVTLFGPALLALWGHWLWEADPWRLGIWCQVSLLAHLATDTAFYNWPVQLLWPLSRRGWALGLVSWNDLVPTILLYSAALVALLFPSLAMIAASGGIGGLVTYLMWRAVKPRPTTGWQAWITGRWAAEAHPFWRWLTGDFIT